MNQPFSVYVDRPAQSAAAALNLASAWLQLCGYDIDVWRLIGCAHVSASTNPGLLAAALDLLAVLDSTPDGRQALADLLGQPVFEDAKSE